MKLKQGYYVYKELNNYNNYYYNFYNIIGESKKKLQKKYNLEDKKNVTFTFYQLGNTLTEEAKKEIQKKYNNIAFYVSQCEYAPEIKKDTMLLCNYKLNQG